MIVTLDKPGFEKIDLPEDALIGNYGPVPFDGPGLTDEQLVDRIRHPIGTPRLAELARGRRRVLIVTDDNTRSTPLDRLVPLVTSELLSAGVKALDITILIGLGTHRAMTPEEILEKFGPLVVADFRIVNHAWNDPAALVTLPQDDLPFPVVVNRLVPESDLVISLGSIVPHATVGFSSGGKTIMPGVCGEATIENTHWMALQFPMREIIGEFDNPMRRAVCAVARRAGLSFIVNVVMLEDGRVIELVAGDPEQAHYAGVQACRKVYGVKIPEIADIVIAESYPCDIDLRQAIKAICSADIVCRDGGVIILPAECPEGVSPQFPEFARIGFRDPEALYRAVEKREYKNKLLAYTLVAIGRIISGRVKAILISPGIDRVETEHMGFHVAANMQQALALARFMTSEHAKITVLRQASILWPFLEKA